MRLLAFDHQGHAALGLRIDDAVVPLTALGQDRLPAELGALLALGPDVLAGLPQAAAAVPVAARLKLATLRLLAPVARPGKVVCVGLNYAEHAREGGNPIPEFPALFLRGTTSLTGPGAPMLRPPVSMKLDYEAELAVVIGRRATRVAEADALDYVAGYTCFNDGSVRDYQRRSTQWTAGKNFDRTGPLGPELVTADELPPGAHGLTIEARVNGRVVQHSTTADMIFPVARLVALISEVMTLEPGDVIATGTPSGVGYARTPPLFLAPGDIVEIEIEGIGVLRNPIADVEPAQS